MAKEQKQPTKTCADCIHESACRGWTDGRQISDVSASQCPNHETVKESGAYLCGVLDERNRQKTNADRLRAMDDRGLAKALTELPLCLERGECEHKGISCSDYLYEWLTEPAEE